MPPPTCSGISQVEQQQQQQQDLQPQESLCAEMAREFCRAMRCCSSPSAAAARRRRKEACEKCSTHTPDYPVDDSAPTPINRARSQVSCVFGCFHLDCYDFADKNRDFFQRGSLGSEASPYIHVQHHSPPQEYAGN